MSISIQTVELEVVAPSILSIVNAAFSRDFDPPTERVDQVTSYLDKCEVYGVFDGTQLVGYFGFHKHSNSEVELKSIAVHPSYQGKGLAKKMMKKMFEEVGEASVWLVVHPKNVSAIQTYLKTGFIPSGWREDFFGDGEPRLVMEK